MKELFSYEFNSFQRFLQKTIGLKRINKDSIDFSWGYFSPKFGLEFVLNQGFYFDQRYSVTICPIWGIWHIKLPFKTKREEQCDWPKYGIQLWHDTLWFHYGVDAENESRIKSWHLPFFHYVYEYGKYISCDGKEYDIAHDNRKYLVTESHTYTYKLLDGTVQVVTATCVREERQWHRKWFPFLKLNERSIDITFSDEVGERAGTWKGGTIGCGWDIGDNETIESALRRMEKVRKFT